MKIFKLVVSAACLLVVLIVGVSAVSNSVAGETDVIVVRTDEMYVSSTGKIIITSSAGVEVVELEKGNRKNRANNLEVIRKKLAEIEGKGYTLKSTSSGGISIQQLGGFVGLCTTYYYSK